MLTAYTRETPARPSLGIITAAAALAVGIGAAALLTRQRTDTLALQPRIRLPNWPMSFAVPIGWKAGRDSSTDSDTTYSDQTVFEGNLADGRPARMTIGYRSLSSGTLAREAVELEAMAFLRADAEDRDAHLSTCTVGPLFGVMVQAQAVTSTGHSHAVVAAACLPNGRTLVVRLEGSGAASHRSLAAMRSVCGSIELTAGAASRPTTVLACDTPKDGLPAPHQGEQPGLQFTATSAADYAWHIDVLPTFLVAGRTPEDLVWDYLVSMEATPRPETVIHAETSNTTRPRSGARAALTMGRTVLDVRAVDLGESRAAIIVAHADDDHGDAINRLCASVAGGLRVETSVWPFDLLKATPAGEALIARIRREGVQPIMPARGRTTRWILEQAGRSAGDDASAWNVSEQEDGSIEGRYALRRVAGGRLAYSLTRDWALRQDGSIARCTEDIRRSVGHQVRMKTEQHQESADASLVYRVSTADNSYDAEFKTPAAFLPDPLIEHVAHALSTGTNTEAVFRTVSLSIRGLAATHMRVVADNADAGESRRVIVTVDFSPEPMVYRFDGRGLVRDIHHGDWRVLRRAKRGETSPVDAPRLEAATDEP